MRGDPVMPYLMAFFITLSLFFTQTAQASIVVGGTRVIYHESEREAKLSVLNKSQNIPYLVQSWVENYDESDVRKVPFMMTPPLFRLDAGKENILRIIKTGEGLPDDREQVFYLNVKSLSPAQKEDQNKLEIAVRTKIKLFWRPARLNLQEAQEAYKKIKMSKSGKILSINNPTPYYVSFMSVKVDGTDVAAADMVAPYSVKEVAAPAGSTVTWQAINDFGGITPVTSVKL